LTLLRFVFGIGASTLVVAALVSGCHRLRHHMVPHWSGPLGWLADLILVMTTYVLTCQLVGTLGLLRPSVVLAGLLLAALVLWAVGGALAKPPGGGEPSTELPVPAPLAQPLGTAHKVGVGGLLVLIISPWLAWSGTAISRGMTSVDTLWYHLPMAVRWAQTGHVGRIQFFDSDPVTAYFPGNSELIHAGAMLVFRTDLVSTVVDVGWLVVALLAAWAVGRRNGVGVVTMLAASLAFASPTMTSTQPGTALTDIVGIALLLVAAAMFLSRAGSSSAAEDALIALTLGLAAGTKFTFLIPGFCLCASLIVLAPAGRRIRRAAVVIGAAALAGGYWYLRNIVVVGNPLPSLDAFGLPSVEGDLATSTVSHFLFKPDAWSRFFVPGFENTLGPLWMVIWLMSLAGMIGAVARRGDPRVRALGVVALLSTIGWLFTPQYLVVGNQPYFFEVNVRYCLPALTMGLVLLPLVFTRNRAAVAGLVAANVVIAQLQPVAWPVGFGDRGVNYEAVTGSAALEGVIALAVLVGVASIVWFTLQGPLGVKQRAAGLTVALTPLVVLVGLIPFHDTYLRNRYRDTPAFGESYQWANTVHRQRIAVLGPFMQLQYPYSGADLSNHVQYLGTPLPNGDFRIPKTCEETIAALNAGQFNYFVSGNDPALTKLGNAHPDMEQIFPTDGRKVGLRIWRLPARSIRPAC